jgi:hypothetical protein
MSIVWELMIQLLGEAAFDKLVRALRVEIPSTVDDKSFNPPSEPAKLIQRNRKFEEERNEPHS